MHKLALFVQKGNGCERCVQPPCNATGGTRGQHVAEYADSLGNDVDHATGRLGCLNNSKYVRVSNSRSSALQRTITRWAMRPMPSVTAQ
jgi:hypothetical protein